jgi:hypothetical protein
VTRRPSSSPAFQEGKRAWFFDLNSETLFVASSKKTGPVAAPSGPLANGRPAGFRARVYSYDVNPEPADLFVGFLERPDPNAAIKAAAADINSFDRWAGARLIKRPEDARWVSAAGPEGRAIIASLTQPNERGQTPIYQRPP